MKYTRDEASFNNKHRRRIDQLRNEKLSWLASHFYGKGMIDIKDYTWIDYHIICIISPGKLVVKKGSSFVKLWSLTDVFYSREK